MYLVIDFRNTILFQAREKEKVLSYLDLLPKRYKKKRKLKILKTKTFLKL